MLLKIMYGQTADGIYSAVTDYRGHTKTWRNANLTSLKKGVGAFLGVAHKRGIMPEIKGLKFVEGVPNDNTVWLLDDNVDGVRRPRRHRRKETRFTQQDLLDLVSKAEPKKKPEEPEDFFYKVENGVLRVYRKTLCHSFKISSLN